MGKALAAMALAATLAGTDAPPPPAPVPAPKEIMRLALSDVDGDQARAEQWHQAGRGSVGVAVGFDPKADLWVKFRQRDHISAHPLSKLQTGVEEDFPDDSYRLFVENGNARVVPVNPPHAPQATASLPALIRQLYNAALHVQFDLLNYAVIRENDSGVPASICLIREDPAGRFYVTYRAPAQLKTINWIASVNGKLFGMRLEGEDLVFYTKPTPQVP